MHLVTKFKVLYLQWEIKKKKDLTLFIQETLAARLYYVLVSEYSNKLGKFPSLKGLNTGE